MVKVVKNTSTSLILNTGAAQGCVQSPLLYSLFTHDCVASHASNSIIKFEDDTTVMGLIINNDETAYREEVRALGVWCQENNLSLNVNKTKEMIVDFRKQQREHPLQYTMSQEGQKDHQGQQQPKPLPVHLAIIQKARSVQVHQCWD